MEARREKARGLLLRLLPPAQREEYIRYNSWRVWVYDARGLPEFKVEIGLSVKGFIVFRPDGRPRQVYNVDMTTGGNWCKEDQLIAIWIRFRREGMTFVNTCCKSDILASDLQRIMERTVHL